MPRSCECPKCGADVSDSYEADDWSCGITAGWYCSACDLGIGDDGHYEPMEGDVGILPSPRTEPIGTPLSQLSGRPGHPGFDEFCRIAKTYGFD